MNYISIISVPRDSSGSLHGDCSISIVSSDTVKKTALPKTVPRLRTSTTCKTRKTQQKTSANNSYPSSDHNFTCNSIGEGADSSQHTADSSSKYVPQRSLLCELPQDVSNLTTFKNRLSPRGDANLRHTGALGPQHPLIRDWYHKKRTSAVTVPSLLNRYKLSLSDSSLATHSKTVKGSCTQTKYCNPHAHTPRVNCIFPLTLGAVHLHPRCHSGESDVWRYTDHCQRPAQEHSQTLPTKSRNPLDWI